MSITTATVRENGRDLPYLKDVVDVEPHCAYEPWATHELINFTLENIASFAISDSQYLITRSSPVHQFANKEVPDVDAVPSHTSRQKACTLVSAKGPTVEDLLDCTKRLLVEDQWCAPADVAQSVDGAARVDVRFKTELVLREGDPIVVEYLASLRERRL